MVKHLTPAIYESLLNRLSELFPGTPTTVALSTVARQGGLDISKIKFFDAAYSVWDAMLSRAEVEEKIMELLKAAQHFYKDDDVINNSLEKALSGEAYIAQSEVKAEKHGVLKEDGKLRIFINYDKGDAACKEKLINFIVPYIKFPIPLPVVFFDVITDILAGSDKQQIAREELERSDVVLLLLSNDFLLKEDGFCYNLALTAKEFGKVLAPVKVRPAPIERIKLISSLKMLPYDEPPLATRDDDTYDKTAGEITKLIEKLLNQQ
jgi:hypothetical protein